MEDLTKRDVKVASLKNLQGYLWEDGYKTGAYSTPLFSDVAPKLKQWHDQEIRLAIYSSGSVFAQKLLFGHVNVTDSDVTTNKRSQANGDAEAAEPAKKRGRTTRSQTAKAAESAPDVKTGTAAEQTATAGPDRDQRSGAPHEASQTEDLTGLMSGWFDTTNAGLKMEADSYRKIIESLQVSVTNATAPHPHCCTEGLHVRNSLTVRQWQASETLFLSDNIKEIDAAVEADLKAILVDRPGNAPVSEADRERMEIVQSLGEMTATPTNQQNSGKRKARNGAEAVLELEATGLNASQEQRPEAL